MSVACPPQVNCESTSRHWFTSGGSSHLEHPSALPSPRQQVSTAVQELYRAINKMKDPSFIRVESDEVTYPMHIVLRYEIEKALLLGELEVDDVPKVWNQKMEAYLGCKPADDAQARPSPCPAP